MIKFQFINLSPKIAEMSVLIGAPVWLGNRPFKQTLSALQKAGFDYLEFSLDFPLPECMRSEEKEELKRMLEDFGLKIAFHSPLDVQTVHPRREIFEASMKVLRKCFEFSSYFSPLYYNLHLHPRISTLKLDEVREQVRAVCLKYCEELAELGSEYGLRLTVENDFMPFEWSGLIHDAISKGMHFTLDVGHAILAEAHFRERRRRQQKHLSSKEVVEILKRWVERCGARMLVVHLHDCVLSGCEKTDHISLGRGELNIEEIFDLLRRVNFNFLLVETFWRNRQKEEMNFEEMRRNVEICRRFLP